MDSFSLFVVLSAFAYVAVIALGIFVGYWVVRLAVRHGSLDARRRWRDEQEMGQRQLDGSESAGH